MSPVALFLFQEVKMDAKNVLQQSPRPEVVIYDPEGKEKMRFDTSQRKILQGYTFGTSIHDEKGKFNLTFYPEEEEREDNFFDDIAPLDIVEIYESRNHFRQYRIDMGRTLVQEVLPTFTGVIREKKFAAQMTDNGPRRSIVFSGHSIIGLVHEFMINMDIQAQVLTEEMANNHELEKAFTIELIRTDNEPLEVSFVVKKIWEKFLKVSEDHGRAANPKIADYITKWAGEDFFVFDDSYFHYPLASVFRGQTTQNFYDVIDGIVPSPIYEKFPLTERKTGKMKIAIRECPFDSEDWDALPCTEINPILVKSFDLRQSDSEVYTYFFSYLTGYPIQEDKAIILAAQGVKESPGGIIDTEKFPMYGYRPLFAHFNGYGKADGEDDTGTGDRLKNLNERLKNWYGNLDKMFSGNIAMETDLSMDMPQAGERVSFLGGEFYVVDSEHRWNYGGAPETNISISRGGDYSGGSFSELKNTTKRYQEFKKGLPSFALAGIPLTLNR
jgi:hypothetical protein